MKTCRLISGTLFGVFLAATTFAADSGTDASVREFGIYNGPPITNGFVFVDGKYIPPPYRVSSRGTVISVNGVWQERVAGWPLPDLTQKTEPPFPDGLSATNTLDDMDRGRLADYIARMERYCKQNLPKDQLVPKMMATYRALPFVTNVVNSEWRTIDIYSNKGKVRHRFLPPDSYFPPLTRDKIAGMIKGKVKWYENTLRHNGSMFVLSGFTQRLENPADTKMNLPVFVYIANNFDTVDEQMDKLYELQAFVYTKRPQWRKFLTNFKCTPELMRRIKALGNGEAEYIERSRDEYYHRKYHELKDAWLKRNQAVLMQGKKPKEEFRIRPGDIVVPDDYPPLPHKHKSL